MRFITALLAICLAFACGAPEDFDDAWAMAGYAGSTGELEEAITGPTAQFNGITYGRKKNSLASCDYLPGTNDVCYVAPHKNITWYAGNMYANSGLDYQTWQLAFTLAAQKLNNAPSQGVSDTGFTFTNSASNPDINLNGSFTVPGDGSKIDHFIRIDPLVGGCETTLTENMPGVWVRQGCFFAYVDGPKFNANTCSGNCKQALSVHIAGQILLAFAAIGYQTSDSTLLSSRTPTVAEKSGSVTSLQRCFLKKFSAANQTSYAHSGTCP